MHSIMERFSNLMERRLTPIAVFLTKQPHIMAVRNALMGTIPIVIIGGLFLILAFPPVDPTTAAIDPNFIQILLLKWYGWSQNHMVALLTPVNMTMGLMGLFIAVGVGYHLAKNYNLDPLSGAFSSLMVFLLVSAPAKTVVETEFLRSGKFEEIISAGFGAMPMTFLDAKGMFTAIIVGLISVDVMKFCKKRNLMITLPEGVPPAVARSFEALIPTTVSVLGFYAISIACQYLFSALIPQLIMRLLEPLVSAYDSALSIFLVAVFAQLLWFIGLHGAAIVGSVTQPFSDMNLLLNAQDKIAGHAMTHIYTGPLWSYFVVIGGSGATLAFLFMLCFSKSSHLKAVGRIGLLPGIFNINEPVIFGVPMVLNSYLFIPFVFTQGINGVIAFLAAKYGLIGKAFINVPWTMPAPVGAFFATLDWRAVVLVILLILMDFLIYWPFFKMFEKSMLKSQTECGEEVE